MITRGGLGSRGCGSISCAGRWYVSWEGSGVVIMAEDGSQERGADVTVGRLTES